MATVKYTAKQIATAWSDWPGKLSTFARMLDDEGIAYLSFSKVSSVTFCSRRYLLEYVERRKLSPEPTYFVKGRLLHEAAAKLHRARRRGRHMPIDQLMKPIRDRLIEEDATHLLNALAVMDREADDGWAVVAVEEPFVLDLGPDLPPCLGIVDLVLRRDGEYAVVDHKSGRQFNKPDRLQLVLYHEHVRRRYRAKRCAAYVDQYRWVNHLDRIRKPARCRNAVRMTDGSWDAALRRLRRSHQRMRRIEQTGRARATGDCIRCPYRNQCSKATVTYRREWY